MASSQPKVVGGKLKLKGAPSPAPPSKTIQKKEHTSAKSTTTTTTTSSVPENVRMIPAPPKPEKTAAERKFEETQAKRQSEQVKKMASKSHKEKVEDFNKYLSTLTEHYDIPKVGPG